MKLALASLFFTVVAYAAVDGTVVNRTTGKPAAGIAVSLVRPGQNGMAPVGSTTADAEGKFHFEEPSPATGPQLVQASYHGINYNKLLTPNAPASGVEVAVYEDTKSAVNVRVVQRMLIFEPNSSQTSLNETVILQNDSNTTFHDAMGGDFRFYLPPAANGQVRISAKGPGGMPLPRSAQKTDSDDVFKIDFPLKPGETELEITYNLLAGTPIDYRGRVVNVPGMQAAPMRLVAPQGVQLSGNDVQAVGTEPKTQATIFNVLPNDFFTVNVAGTGGFRNPAETNAGGEDSDSPPLHDGQPQIYTHMTWLVTLTFAILGIGLVYLYRTSPEAPRS